MFKLFKQEPPYDQSEIAEQVRIIGELQQQADMRSTKLDEYNRCNSAIEAAQEVLLFMQDENKDYHDKIRNRKSHR